MRPETLRPPFSPPPSIHLLLFAFPSHPSDHSVRYTSSPVPFSTLPRHVFSPWLIHHVLSPAVVTLLCNYLIFMPICRSCWFCFLCTLRVPATPRSWLGKKRHNSSQRETFDWPDRPHGTQRDLFDPPPLSAEAVVFGQTMNALITFRQRVQMHHR